MSAIASHKIRIPGWLRSYFRLTKPKDLIGRWGERAARKYLRSTGAIAVTTNWRNKIGELDLIAIDKRTLLIVEVKTRHISQLAMYPAIAAVTHDKRHRLESLGRSFMRNHGPFCRRYAISNRRTDVIEVYYSRSWLGTLKACRICWHKGITT